MDHRQNRRLYGIDRDHRQNIRLLSGLTGTTDRIEDYMELTGTTDRIEDCYLESTWTASRVEEDCHQGEINLHRPQTGIFE